MGTRGRTFVALVSLTALVAFGTACGDDDDSDAGTATSAAQPATSGAPSTEETEVATSVEAAAADVCTEDKVGGTLTFSTSSPTTSLDPTVALGSGAAGGIELAALYDNLLRFNPETGEYEPHVAESFESNADRSEWTVKLRPGIRFGNGDPLTTEAVKFSFERMAQARVSSAALAATVESMEIVDDLTIVFKLHAPFGQFPYVLAEDTGAIVNPNVVNAVGAEAFGTNPRGAGVGPYEFERFAPGEEVVMRAKTDYWGGPVCIETLRFVNVPGAAGTYDAFRNGEVDMAYFGEPRVVAEAIEAGYEGYKNTASANSLLFMNIARGSGSPLRDLRLRQAVAAALDVELINERVNAGAGLASSALVWRELPIYPGIDGPAYDPEQARQIIEELKAEGFDGRLRLTGSATPQGTELAVTIEALLEAVGLTIEVETLPPAESSRKILIEGNFDLGLSGMSIYEDSPYARLDQFETGSVRTRTGYSDPGMDEALDQLRRAETRDEKREALGLVQEVWNETIPSAVLASTNEFVAQSDAVRGVVFSRDTVALFHDAYLEDA